jgi:hypothetical protein
MSEKIIPAVTSKFIDADGRVIELSNTDGFWIQTSSGWDWMPLGEIL